MADRYISDRHLPDKAIDVIDETGSRVRLARLNPPEDIKKLEGEIEGYEAGVAETRSQVVE